MSDDPNERGTADRSRIDVSQEHECRYWSQKFGVTPEQLKFAVERVGPMADDVHRELSNINMRASQ